jgi:hypothetical protein
MTGKPFRFLLAIFFLFNLTATAQTARQALLKGVDSLPMPSRADGVAFFYTTNHLPEIIATASFNLNVKMRGATILASALGKGKVLAIGSSAYLRTDSLFQNSAVITFWKNTLQWAGNGKKSLRVALSKEVDNPALRNFLGKQKAKTYSSSNLDLKSNTDIVVLSADVTEAAEQQKLEKFITGGGTLIFTSPYPDNFKNRDTTKTYTATGLAMEPLLAKAGIFNANVFVSQSEDLTALHTDSIPDYLHINTLLPRLLMPGYDMFNANINYYFMQPTLQLVMKYNNVQSQDIKNIRQYFDIPDTLTIPSPARPWVMDTEKKKVAARLSYMLYAAEHGLDQHPEAKAPGYQTFPGEVPANAKRGIEKVTVKVKVGKHGLVEPASVYYRPHSTGLYVPAGERVIIKLSEELSKQNLKAQVGIHHDEVFDLDQVTRPAIDLTKVFDLDKTVNEVYSPYGGLLLLNIADTSILKTISIRVEGAVKSPYFKLGETTEADWMANVRNNPAPWAELATDKIVLTVPSDRIRNLNNPIKLMQFWDEVLDADADLAIVSRNRAYRERIIVDSDVAYGYMFCMPDRIVVPNDNSAAMLVDEAVLRSKGSWGHFHELGHRHQFRDLDFPGTIEVTVNLFTMYVYDKVLHKGLYNHDAIPNKDALIKKIKTYLDNEPSYDKWKEDPFLALSMYGQIIDAFGWAPILAANKVYRDLPKDQYPKTDQKRCDLWFNTICKATNSNMSRFFKVWKVPVSDDAKNAVEGYKVWFPGELDAYK